MKHKQIHPLFFVFLSIIFLSCKTERDISQTDEPISGGKLVIAIRSDIDFFNPLYSNDINSGLINDLIYGALTYSEFDLDSGKLVYYPNLAKGWKISDDKKSITYYLKTNLRWSDGVKFSARDVQYSYFLYTNPEVMSVRKDAAEYFVQKNGRIDTALCFKILNDSVIVFNFSHQVDDPLFITGLPILPEHIFKKIPLNKIFESEVNYKPTGIGPFKLENYSRQQQIVLVRNDSVNYDKIPLIEKIIFKIIPDYNSRLNQLKNGEADLMTEIRPEDVENIKKNYGHINIESISGRDYDYIGWNNIEQKIFNKSKGRQIVPHRLFGSKEVRLALTMAVNRKEILQSYFGGFAQIAEAPVSPVFKTFFNEKLKSIPYNPEEAKKILEKNGWKDTNGDGIIDKNGIPFKFKLNIAAGKPHREFAAAMVKNDLRKIGIEAEIEVLETSTFFSNLFERKMDAWIAGWTVPLELDLEAFWGSDLNKNFFNVCSYQNPEVDNIFKLFKKSKSFEEKTELMHKFQEIIQSDQPVTFLYWIDNIVGYNKKLKNVHLNPIAYTNRIWEWFIIQ